MDNYEHIDLENEKIIRIVHAAYKVFAQNDLEKASTNQIVKQAGVSRGLLYHYFKDKDDLFNFLIYFCMKIILVDIQEKIDWDDSDLFKRIIDVTISRMQMTNNYPYFMEFWGKYKSRINRDRIYRQMEEMSPGLRDKFYTHNVDYSQVKEGVDVDRMIEVVRYTVRGINKKYWEIAVSKHEKIDIDGLKKEIEDFFCFFRKHFYKA